MQVLLTWLIATDIIFYLPAKIAIAKLTDGLCVFVTNHIDIDGGNYRKPAKRIIQAYREKTQIEDAFKNIKSFVKIRPFFVN